MKSTTSVTIEVELRRAMKEVGIKGSQALEFGARFLLAEHGYCEFPTNSQTGKLERAMLKLNEVTND